MKKNELTDFCGGVLDRQTIVSYDQIPEIPLYMDQLTTFFDEKMKGHKRFKSDKILTKTMINNYTKANLIPPSDKKKYDRDHAALLIIVYHLKSGLTINDISALFDVVEAAGLSVRQFYALFEQIQRLTSKNDGFSTLSDNFADIFDEKTIRTVSETDETRGIAAVLFYALSAGTRKLLAERVLDKISAPLIPV